MLYYLQKCHGISTETIYNDLHGFIKDEKVHRSARAKFRAGCNFQKKGNYQQAIEYYTESIKLRPWSGAYNNRGTAYKEIGKLELAIVDFNQAIELDPKLADFYNNRGTIYRKMGALDQAIEDFNQAIKLKPEYAEAYNNRGIAYDDKGKVDFAIADYSTAIDLNPKLAEPYNNRGIANLRKGAYDQAIEDFNKVIELKPDYADAYINRGNAYNNKGKVDLAIADYNKAIELARSFPMPISIAVLLTSEQARMIRPLKTSTRLSN